jgi:hypothetical protein
MANASKNIRDSCGSAWTPLQRRMWEHNNVIEVTNGRSLKKLPVRTLAHRLGRCTDAIVARGPAL